MTINGFWKALGDSCCREVNLKIDIVGKKLAVDLSAWIVEAATSQNLQAIHANPHLFLVFSRALWLRKLDCNVIYVIENAQACILKSTIPRLRLARMGYECERILRALGCVCLHAPAGIEAEAVAAALNAQGFVDSVVTADGDAFAYAARSVIRDLNQDAIKNNRCKIYHVDQHEIFGVFTPQRCVIAFALLTGSDLSIGIDGIGSQKALRFLKLCNLFRALRKIELDPIDIMCAWRDSIHLSIVFDDPIANSIQTHCATSSFPDEIVLNAFIEQPRSFVSSISSQNGEETIH